MTTKEIEESEWADNELAAMKRKIEPPVAGSATCYAPPLPPDPDFDCWWSINHPFDWWTKERGKPLPHADRLRVWNICRAAWAAAHNGEISDRRETPL